MPLPGAHSGRNTVRTRIAVSTRGLRHGRGGRQAGRFDGRLLGGILLGLTHHSRLTNLRA